MPRKRKAGRSVATGFRPIKLTKEALWGIAGMIAGFNWFWRTYTFPGSLTGRNWGDAVGYIQRALDVHSWFQFLTDYDVFSSWGTDRVRGYPLFLYFHRWILEGLGLSYWFDWVNVSKLTAFGLHCASAIFLYRSVLKSKIRLHPVALALLLASPGLTGYAALALTDSVSTTCVMFGLAGILRYQAEEKNAARWWAIFSGAAFGIGVLCRPSLQPASLLVLLAWVIMGIARSRSKAARPRSAKKTPVSLTPALAILGYLAVLSPQYAACTLRFGSICQLRPGYVEAQLPDTIRLGLASARCTAVHGSMGTFPPGPNCIPDPFMKHWFADQCSIGNATVKSDLIRCFVTNLPRLPVFLGKKVIGLFDHSHISGYAAFVTSPLERLWARVFGVIGFVGFICSVFLLGRGLLRQPTDPRLLLGVFSFFYIGMSTIAHVETRYGFPATPISLFSFVLVTQEILRQGIRKSRIGAFAMISLALLFILQVTAWDRLDIMHYEDLQHYLDRTQGGNTRN